MSELREKIESAVQALGYELVNLETEGQRGRLLLRVFIDREGGVTLDGCAVVSRQISSVLDVEIPDLGNYHLEVSSPGLDRPLLTKAHYQRFMGHKIKLRLRMPINNQRNFKGVIKVVEGDEIFLELEEGNSLKINLTEIEKANLEPVW